MTNAHFVNSRQLPLVVEPESADNSLDFLLKILPARRNFFRERLLQTGALVLRGFQIRTIAEFENFVSHFSGADFFNYAGGVSPRLALSGSGVYTSTEYPPHLALALHNELSYSAVFPRHLYFFCHTAPESGGETTLGDSRRILRAIEPRTVDLFKRKKVRYDRNLSCDKGSGYSWQDAFETDDKNAVENICRKVGASFEWKQTGGLRVSQIRPATAIHPETGEEVWFNQADGFHSSNLDAETLAAISNAGESLRLDSRFGDGSPLAVETLENVRAVLRRETVAHRWQTGDVLILDNLLTAHGRLPFSGARKIALAMI